MNKDFLKRKDSFIIRAIQLLDELGVQGITTRELAKREGVTEPALYRQFTSKDEIVLAVVEEFAKFDECIMNTVVENKMSYKEALFYFSETFAEYYQGYQEIVTVMFAVDFYRNVPEAKEKMTALFAKRVEFVRSILIKARDEEGVVFDSSVEELADMIIGLIYSITHQWKYHDTTQSLKEKIRRALAFLLRE